MMNVDQIIESIGRERLAIMMINTPYVYSSFQFRIVPGPEYNKYLKDHIPLEQLLSNQDYEDLKNNALLRYLVILWSKAPKDQQEQLFRRFNIDLDMLLPELYYFKYIQPDTGIYSGVYAKLMNKHIEIIIKEANISVLCSNSGCKNLTNKVCNKCKVARYCCIEHLHQDWVNHKQGCIKYREASNSN